MPNQSAYVQVVTDGTGKKIANVSVTDTQGPDTSGNAQADVVRYQQTVTLASPRGDISDVSGEILAELRAIHEALDLIAMKLS